MSLMTSGVKILLLPITSVERLVSIWTSTPLMSLASGIVAIS